MKTFRHLLLIAVLSPLWLTAASGQTVTSTKILDNGLDGRKLVFAVLGDGYAAADRTKYINDVNNLVINGVLAHDFYAENRRAFNVYRIDQDSAVSGVSTDLNTIKDTALKTVYTGNWNRCWIEESKDSDDLINEALRNVPKYDFVLIIQNETGFGGCRRGIRLYVTSGVNWDVVAHEYGHGIVGLYDEYSVPSKPNYAGLPVNTKNCSTLLDNVRVTWSSLLTDPSIVIPPKTDFAPPMDSNQTVGMFEGCATYMRGIYRPVHNCRMNGNTPMFCPVCRRLMQAAVAPFLDATPVAVNSSLNNLAPETLTGLPLVRASFSYGPRLSRSAAQQSGEHLQVVWKTRKSGDGEVISLTRVQSALPDTQEQPSNTVVEVTNGGQTVAVEFLPDDPFVVRGFVDPQRPEQGELYAETDEATIILKAPLDMEDALRGQIKVKLYGVTSDPGATIDANQEINLEKLRSDKRLTKEGELKGGEIRKAITERGTRFKTVN